MTDSYVENDAPVRADGSIRGDRLKEYVRKDSAPETNSEPEGPEIDFRSADRGPSLREVANELSAGEWEKKERLAAELKAYEAAAGISTEPRELPDLNKSDADIQAEQFDSLRAELEGVREKQSSALDDYQAQAAAQQQQAQAIQNATAAAQNLTAYSEHLQNLAAQEFQALREEFPYEQINDNNDIIRLAQTDAFFASRLKEANDRIGAAQWQTHQAVQQYEATFAQAAHPHDAQFAKNHPDLMDPSTGQATGAGMKARAGVLAMLRESYSEKDIIRGWKRGEGPLAGIRTLNQQEAMLELWRAREAKKNLAAGKYRDLPPVQRPGVRSGNGADMRGGVSESELRQLNDRLNKTGSLRDAAKLRAAKDAYRRGT